MVHGSTTQLSRAWLLLVIWQFCWHCHMSLCWMLFCWMSDHLGGPLYTSRNFNILKYQPLNCFIDRRSLFVCYQVSLLYYQVCPVHPMALGRTTQLSRAWFRLFDSSAGTSTCYYAECCYAECQITLVVLCLFPAILISLSTSLWIVLLIGEVRLFAMRLSPVLSVVSCSLSCPALVCFRIMWQQSPPPLQHTLFENSLAGISQNMLRKTWVYIKFGLFLNYWNL